jgi:hypothetical protein
MLKQEDLAFLKALSSIKASQALLQELRKVRVTQRRKKALAVAGSALSQSKPGSTALPAPHLPKQSAGKRKATEPASHALPYIFGNKINTLYSRQQS